MFNSRISSIVLYVLLAVGAIMLVLFFVGGVTPETAGSQLTEPKFTETALKLAYIYFGAAAILALLFPIIGIFSNPKGTLGALLYLLVFVGVFIVAYLLASNEVLPNLDNKANVAGSIKLVDAGLLSTYIFGGIAFLGIAITEIAGIFRK